MAKWIFMVESKSTDPARDDEFNEWYDKIHLPDIMETPGFIRATRYENRATQFAANRPLEGKTEFLAIYEIEADDIDGAIKAMYENVAKKKAAGRYSELLVLVSRGIYRQISSLSK